MESRDFDRIRFITQHFNDLQGLRYAVPLGLITLGWAGPAPLGTALSLGALLFLLGAKRYYRKAFGEVERQAADPAAELCPATIYDPAGPPSRIEGFRQVTPIARHFLTIVAVAVLLFSFFQSIPSNIVVSGDESLGQHPQILLEPAPILGPPIIEFLDGSAVRSPSMLRAVFSQMMYLLHGSLLLGIWLWRGRRESQSHHLALALLLLGLAALGTSLGFLARPDGEIPRLIDFVLPALVYPRLAVLLCGSSMVLTGLFDHWQLVRALGRPAAA